MSGHSKWATIKRQKGVADIKRGQQFTKLANAIVIAVKQNGGVIDPETNFKLRLAIDKARSYNMPKENIERAIQKAKGSADSGDLHEALYEGFAPGGAAILIEAVTDNKQRTVAEVKNVLEKNGGTLGNQGSVSYLFNRVGEIAAQINGKTSDELLDIALELDSTDFLEDSGDVIFYVDPSRLAISKKLLEEKGMIIASAELVFKPVNEMEISEDAKSKIVSLIEKLEDLGDVQNVSTNTSVY
ncbi:MAG TPA: YebC/PmpR family DNA-binding transcriptional regulator [Candidatus Levybacteria bacterium]|nr:YebC/PmpR family DNA-binding transcriptional regulator [Candidatus Levybacteria bacterium]